MPNMIATATAFSPALGNNWLFLFWPEFWVDVSLVPTESDVTENFDLSWYVVLLPIVLFFLYIRTICYENPNAPIYMIHPIVSQRPGHSMLDLQVLSTWDTRIFP